MASLEKEGITADDTTFLHLVQLLLQWMGKRLRQEKLPCGQDLVLIMKGIEAMCVDSRLEGVRDVNIVTLWDNFFRTSGFGFRICFHSSLLNVRYQVQCRPNQNIVSLQRLLEKLFTLLHHIRTVTRIAWSSRFSQFLKGEFQVVLVPANHHDIFINFSWQEVLPNIFVLAAFLLKFPVRY